MRHTFRFLLIVLLLLTVVTHLQAQDTPTPEPFATNTPDSTPEVTVLAPVEVPPTVAPGVVTIEPEVTSEVVSLYERLLNFAGALVGALVLLFGFTQYLHSSERKQTNASLAASFPPGVSAAIQAGAPLALSAAEHTATKVDDIVLKNILSMIGYDVAKTDTGYNVTLKPDADKPIAA